MRSERLSVMQYTFQLPEFLVQNSLMVLVDRKLGSSMKFAWNGKGINRN